MLCYISHIFFANLQITFYLKIYKGSENCINELNYLVNVKIVEENCKKIEFPLNLCCVGRSISE